MFVYDAYRFYKCGWADDGTGLELVIEPWLEGLWDPLIQTIQDFPVKNSVAITDDENKSPLRTVESKSESNISYSGLKKIEDNNTSSMTGASSSLDDMKDITEKVEELALFNLTEKDTAKRWRANHILRKLEFPPDYELTIPKSSVVNTFSVEFSEIENLNGELQRVYQNGAPLPSAEDSIIHECDVTRFCLLSHPDVEGKPVKSSVEVVLKLPCDACYEPGDSVAVLAGNSDSDVTFILERLRIKNPEKQCRILPSDNIKKQPPLHLARHSTVRQIFTECVDLRCRPKKAMLLALMNSTTDQHEKRCLQELVSKEGSLFFQSKVIETRLTILDILNVFDSCQPELSVVLGFLPRITPRPYSLTSSPLNEKNEVSFVYSLVNISKSDLILNDRFGLCTGAFHKLQTMKSLDPHFQPKLALYFRNNKSFRLPADSSKPIIMIGPGTGVAPLVGFLRHRSKQVTSGLLKIEELGTAWLYFGCRYPDVDEIFKEEVNEFLSTGVLTNLRVCYSRNSITKTGAVVGTDGAVQTRYVQDLLRHDAAVLAGAMVMEGAYVYVCGDASNMSKDVQTAITDILINHLGDSHQGTEFIKNMQRDKKYLQEVWT